MPEIAEIFRDHHKEYFRRNNAPPEVIRTIFDIEKCCTPAMGAQHSLHLSGLRTLGNPLSVLRQSQLSPMRWS